MSTNLPVPADGSTGPTSMVRVRVGGRTVAAKTGARCAACQSPHRADIDGWILQGYTRPTILGYLQDLPEGPLGHPTDKSLRHHTDKHLPLASRSQAAILDRRAEQLGEEIEKYGGRVADHLSALDIVVLRGFDALQNGDITVDSATLMKAIDLKHKIEMSADGGVDANVWRDALMEYMRIGLSFIPADKKKEFAAALTESPVLAALSKAQQQTY
ncbi:hypothetical protein E6R60_26400 [Streptomyces sp. A0642]|uniref:hypothetical protein n=1 Tax=Streptomyces sp. A0642 TaxID=2563100 RepID=UPI0010A27A83|nr:hypothetical protein [Streptomyces sp. A0642]THA72465.1 hypothetical protein E6R60_26400 [Streptomyces sp. A0642]